MLFEKIQQESRKNRVIIIFGMYTDISEEWREECEHIKLMSEPLELQDFGLQKIERCLASEFKVVQYMTQTEKHLKKFYTDPGHFSFNRHPNTMAFDQNRPILGDEAQRNSPDNYINANIVEANGHKCIATQGPLHTTINNFWRMIEQYKVTAIFMLCERVEKNKVKCDLYWPTSEEEPLTTKKEEEEGKSTPKYIVTACGTEQKKYLKIRKFKLQNLETKEIRDIAHYQVMGWPDGDKPDEKIQKCVGKVLQILVNYLQNDEMTAIHCSAGVGRTGTFIAMAEIKMLISKVDKISIFQIVRKLREQRWAMIYSSAQYEYLYDFTEAEANKHFQPAGETGNNYISNSDEDSDE